MGLLRLGGFLARTRQEPDFRVVHFLHFLLLVPVHWVVLRHGSQAERFLADPRQPAPIAELSRQLLERHLFARELCIALLHDHVVCVSDLLRRDRSRLHAVADHGQGKRLLAADRAARQAEPVHWAFPLPSEFLPLVVSEELRHNASGLCKEWAGEDLPAGQAEGLEVRKPGVPWALGFHAIALRVQWNPLALGPVVFKERDVFALLQALHNEWLAGQDVAFESLDNVVRVIADAGHELAERLRVDLGRFRFALQTLPCAIVPGIEVVQHQADVVRGFATGD